MLKQNQNIDGLIQGIRSIKNRCSLSSNDIKILDEVVKLLEEMKQEKSEERQAVMFVRVMAYLTRFFSEDISNFFDGMME